MVIIGGCFVRLFGIKSCIVCCDLFRLLVFDIGVCAGYYLGLMFVIVIIVLFYVLMDGFTRLLWIV